MKRADQKLRTSLALLSQLQSKLDINHQINPYETQISIHRNMNKAQLQEKQLNDYIPKQYCQKCRFNYQQNVFLINQNRSLKNYLDSFTKTNEYLKNQLNKANIVLQNNKQLQTFYQRQIKQKICQLQLFNLQRAKQIQQYKNKFKAQRLCSIIQVPLNSIITKGLKKDLSLNNTCYSSGKSNKMSTRKLNYQAHQKLKRKKQSSFKIKYSDCQCFK